MDCSLALSRILPKRGISLDERVETQKSWGKLHPSVGPCPAFVRSPSSPLHQILPCELLSFSGL